MIKTQRITRTALFTALICLTAPFTVQIGPIPLSLATFAVCLSAGALGRTLGTLAVVVYILLGAAGLPVFSNFGAGIPKLLGVTGGFIFGYVPLAFITGSFATYLNCRWKYALGMTLGTIVLYASGCAWYIIQTGSNPLSALTLCVFPFLPGDAVKIAGASMLAPVLAAMYRHSDSSHNPM